MNFPIKIGNIAKRRRWWLAGALGALLIWIFCLPKPLFDSPTSMVLEDRDGNLLGARIAADGQWRFPESDSIPEKFKACITAFEDKRFFYHPGVDPISMGRALVQNLREGRVVSGGSTLTMQVIRLARKGRSRTLYEKFVEVFMATRLEVRFSKKRILNLYASHAPFGGNVVGLEAASWRYFGKSPFKLSWAEAATLAVLPNSPALIHPGRNRQALLEKRDRLLDKLLAKGKLDPMTCSLAKDETLPAAPLPLPMLAPQLLDRSWTEIFKGKKHPHTKLKTTLQKPLQEKVTQIARQHLPGLKANQIHNMAIVVLDVETGQALAYLGNAPETGAEHGEQVDIVKAPRSTGSLLKPLLYASMLQQGFLLPESMVSDIPMNYSGYAPENYLENYEGAVSVKKALYRSLNVPMVRMLELYSVEKFHYDLRNLGFTTITKSPEYYGLPLILGGAEASLWELTNTFACMARTLRHYSTSDGMYFKADFRPATYLLPKPQKTQGRSLQNEPPKLGAASIWATFEAMKKVERPNSEGQWEYFSGSVPIAWKTGTSYGFRDAWAIGVTPEYAVGVWVGNADGEGRPGLIGVQTAAPVLFQVFENLSSGSWFDLPYDDMVFIPVCRQSGFRASEICPSDSVWVPRRGLAAPACPFHQMIHLDQTGTWQVNSSCENPAFMIHKPWFVLPPVEEFYFKTKNPAYKNLPPFKPGCEDALSAGGNPMQWIYPRDITRIFIPRDLDGKPGKTVFKAAHRNPDATLFWHLDQVYMAQTKFFHHFECAPAPGLHQLTLVDEAGNRMVQTIEILETPDP